MLPLSGTWKSVVSQSDLSNKEKNMFDKIFTFFAVVWLGDWHHSLNNLLLSICDRVHHWGWAVWPLSLKIAVNCLSQRQAKISPSTLSSIEAPSFLDIGSCSCHWAISLDIVTTNDYLHWKSCRKKRYDNQIQYKKHFHVSRRLLF